MFAKLYSFREGLKKKLENESNQAKQKEEDDLYSSVQFSPVITDDDTNSYFKIFFDNDYTSKKNILLVKQLHDGYSVSVSRRGDVHFERKNFLTLENKKFIKVSAVKEVYDIINCTLYANIITLKDMEKDLSRFIKDERLPLSVELLNHNTLQSVQLHFINSKDIFINVYKLNLDIILPFTISLKGKKDLQIIPFDGKPFINFIDISIIKDWIKNICNHYKSETDDQIHLRQWLGGTPSVNIDPLDPVGSMGPEHEEFIIPQKPVTTVNTASAVRKPHMHLHLQVLADAEKVKVVDFSDSRKTFRIISATTNPTIVKKLGEAEYMNIKYVHGSYCFSTINAELMENTRNRLAKVGLLVSPTVSHTISDTK